LPADLGLEEYPFITIDLLPELKLLNSSLSKISQKVSAILIVFERFFMQIQSNFNSNVSGCWLVRIKAAACRV
jgi:hypothetical protein